MTTHRILLIVLSAFFTIQMAVAQEAKLRRSDAIQIKISGVPQEDEAMISDVYTIDDRGAIELPYINVSIKAEGLTPSVLARRIKEIYKNTKIFKYPSISVTGKDQEKMVTRRVAVSGEVRTERVVPFVEGMRLLEAITGAGGFSDFADKRKVRVMRGNQTYTCDLRNPSSYPEQNLKLLPGDQVIVRHR